MSAFMIIPYGPGISTDAVNYLAASENLALGHGFLGFDGEPYLLWPPLHPILLAIPRALFNIDPKTSAWAISLFAFPVIILLTGVFFHQAMPNQKLWGYLGILTVLFSTTMLGLAINLGSDLPFVILTLLFFIVFQWFSKRSSLLALSVMILLALLASIERYIGVTLVAAGFFGTLILYRRNPRKGFLLALLFAGIALAPLMLWVGRNYAVTGTLFGLRNPSAWRVTQNLSDAATKISHWFIPYLVTSNKIFLITFGLALGILIGRQPGNVGKRIAGTIQKPIILITILFTVMYFFLSMVLIKTEDHTLLYDDRYYAPIFVPLFMLLFLAIDGIVLSKADSRSWLIPKSLLLGLFAIWLVFPIYSCYKLWRTTSSLEGVSVYNIYNFPWLNNSLVNENLLAQAPLKYEEIYSNYAAEVFLFTRTISKGPPSRSNFLGEAVRLKDYAGKWPESFPALLVWYEPNTKKNLFSPSQLESLANLELIFDSKDGSIYRIDEPKP
jgi:hypothetical protein